MIAPRASRLLWHLNRSLDPLLTANPQALAGHVERLLIQQEELFDAARGGVDKSLRARFDARVRTVNVALCGAWEEAQEMIRRGVPAWHFEVTQSPAVRYPHEKQWAPPKDPRVVLGGSDPVEQDESDGGVGDDFALCVSYSGTN